MDRVARILVLLGALLAPSLAMGQATVLQGNPWTPGHVPVYSASGGSQPIIVDSGITPTNVPSGRTNALSPFTIYVNNATGSDSNPGTSAAPFLHIQAAVNLVCNNYIFNITAQPVVQLQTTGVVYNENVFLCNYMPTLSWLGSASGGLLGYFMPIIQGNVADNTQVTVGPSNGTAFSGVEVKAAWIISSMTITATGTGGIEILADAGSVVYGYNLNYGAATDFHVATLAQGLFEDLAGPFTISGGALNHWSADFQGQVICQGNAVTIKNTPNFSGSFLSAENNSSALLGGCTFSGSATGMQYVVDESSAGAVQFPTGGMPGSIGSAPISPPFQGVFASTAPIDYRCLLTAATQAISNACSHVQLAAGMTGPITWTLPEASTVPGGRVITISAAVSTFPITVAVHSGDGFMDGSTQRVMLAPGETLVVESGSGISATGFWNVVSEPQATAVAWSPTLLGSGTAGSPSYNFRVGSYDHLGNSITLRFNVSVSSLGGAVGNLQIGNLPAASTSTSNDLGACSMASYTGWTADSGFTNLTGLINSGASSVVMLTEVGSTKTAQFTPVSDYAASTQIVGTCTYHF